MSAKNRGKKGQYEHTTTKWPQMSSPYRSQREPIARTLPTVDVQKCSLKADTSLRKITLSIDDENDEGGSGHHVPRIVLTCSDVKLSTWHCAARYPITSPAALALSVCGAFDKILRKSDVLLPISSSNSPRAQKATSLSSLKPSCERYVKNC